jgi:oxepin-CoA hydrolase/3-oxo-5,6-dehydrosuberyl-CoA semialdehyde dehydrogenase
MEDQKLAFLDQGFFALLEKLSENTPAKWGKMNAQQMVEHAASFYDVSSGKLQFNLVTPEEHLPKYKEFLLSDKAFKENTKAPVSVIGEEPLPVKYSSLEEAIKVLRSSVDSFIAYFTKNPGHTTTHPVFGPLNFNEWILLHHKHMTHHARQFGLMD